jgi:hypothetical protein
VEGDGDVRWRDPAAAGWAGHEHPLG